jgi:hypothetical protein
MQWMANERHLRSVETGLSIDDATTGSILQLGQNPGFFLRSMRGECSRVYAFRRPVWQNVANSSPLSAPRRPVRQ